MPNIDDLVPSKSNFLKKEDVGVDGVDLTIAQFIHENIKNQESGETEQKACIVWTDQQFLPLVLNKENASRLKMCLKTSDTDEMIGKSVNVYHDEFVSFGGKQVGGVRIRPAKRGAPAPRAAQPQQRRAAPPPARQAAGGDMGPDSPPLEAYGDNDVPY